MKKAKMMDESDEAINLKEGLTEIFDDITVDMYIINGLVNRIYERLYPIGYNDTKECYG